MKFLKDNLYLVLSNILFALNILVFDILYIVQGDFAFKIVASVTFLVCGACNLAYTLIKKKCKSTFAIILLIGLLFACLGDILLEIEFIAGAALFAIGHIFFLISFYFLQKFSIWDIVCSGALILFAMLVIFLYKGFTFESTMMLAVVVIYAIIISIMLGKAISTIITSQSKKFPLLVMIGAFLFFFSDMMLLFTRFANINDGLFSALCLGTYYPAEFLLALSLAIIGFIKSEKKD